MVANNKPPVLKDQLGLRPVLPPRPPKERPDIPPLLQEVEKYFAQKPGAKIINQQGYFDDKEAAIFKARLAEWEKQLIAFSKDPQNESSRRLIEAYLGRIQQGNGMIDAARANFSKAQAPQAIASNAPHSAMADNVAGNRERPQQPVQSAPTIESLKARLQAGKEQERLANKPQVEQSPPRMPLQPIDKPPNLSDHRNIQPIQPRPNKQVSEAETAAETALQSISNYFATAPGKKVFAFESGKFNADGAKLYKTELEAQQMKLNDIKVQYANEIKNSPYLKNAIGELQTQIQQGNTVIQLKQDGLSREAQQPLAPPEKKSESTNPFKRILNKTKDANTEPKPVVESDFTARLNREFSAYQSYYQDQALALKEFGKEGIPKIVGSLNAADKAKYGPMADSFLQEKIAAQFLSVNANMSISATTQNTLEPRIAEMISTEQTFNKNMKQLSNALDYLAKNDPAQARQYQHLQKGLPEIIKASDALLADMSKIQSAQGPDKVKLACIYLDPVKIKAEQAVCANYCTDYMTVKSPLLKSLIGSADVKKMPKDVQDVATSFSNFTVQPMQRISRFEILLDAINKAATKTSAPPEVQSSFQTLYDKSKEGSKEANNAMVAGPKPTQQIGEKNAVQNVSPNPGL